MGESSNNSDASGVGDAWESSSGRCSDLAANVSIEAAPTAGSTAAVPSASSASVPDAAETCTHALPAKSPRSVTRYYEAMLREKDQLLEFEKGFLAAQLEEERAVAHREQDNLRERIRQHAVCERQLAKEVSTLLLEREALKKEVARAQQTEVPHESHCERRKSEGDLPESHSQQQRPTLRRQGRHQQVSLSSAPVSDCGARFQIATQGRSSPNHVDRRRSRRSSTGDVMRPRRASVPTKIASHGSLNEPEHEVRAAVVRSLQAKSEHLLLDQRDVSTPTLPTQKSQKSDEGADSVCNAYMRHMQAYARRVLVSGQGGA